MLLNWLYFYGGTGVFLQEGVGVGHIQTVCTIRSRFMSLEDNGGWGAIIEGNMEQITFGQPVQFGTLFMTPDYLRANTSINFKWLASLKIGFEKDDLLGHWLRTSLKRISFANTVLLVVGMSGPCMGQANTLFRCRSWVSEMLNISLFLEDENIILNFQKELFNVRSATVKWTTNELAHLQ